MPDMMPEFGINEYFSATEALPDFPNVNVYQSVGFLRLGLQRIDVAIDALLAAPAANLTFGEDGRKRAIDRLSDARARIELVWLPILEKRIAALNVGEDCASLEAPGSGVFTWFYQPGPIVTDPDAPGYLMPGEWQKYGITKAQATTYYTPEYTAPDAYIQNYLIDPTAAQIKLEETFDQGLPAALEYECTDKRWTGKPYTPTFEHDIAKGIEPARGFPWWILIAAAGAYAVTRRR